MFAILKKLRSLKTSADFAETMPALQSELDAARGNLASLKARLRSAAFDEHADGLDALRRSIREAEDGVELLEGTLDETRKRRDAADEAERRSEAERAMVGAQLAYSASSVAWREFAHKLTELEALASELEAHDGVMRAANGQAERLGFPGLKIAHPGLPPMKVVRSHLIGLRELGLHDRYEAMERRSAA